MLECEHFEERNRKIHNGILLLAPAYHICNQYAITWPPYFYRQKTNNYQLPAHFSVVLLLKCLHLLPLPDLLLQLPVVHRLVVLVCCVPDIVADGFLYALISLEPGQLYSIKAENQSFIPTLFPGSQ